VNFSFRSIIMINLFMYIVFPVALRSDYTSTAVGESVKTRQIFKYDRGFVQFRTELQF